MFSFVFCSWTPNSNLPVCFQVHQTLVSQREFEMIKSTKSRDNAWSETSARAHLTIPLLCITLIFWYCSVILICDHDWENSAAWKALHVLLSWTWTYLWTCCLLINFWTFLRHHRDDTWYLVLNGDVIRSSWLRSRDLRSFRILMLVFQYDSLCSENVLPIYRWFGREEVFETSCSTTFRSCWSPTTSSNFRISSYH